MASRTTAVALEAAHAAHLVRRRASQPRQQAWRCQRQTPSSLTSYEGWGAMATTRSARSEDLHARLRPAWPHRSLPGSGRRGTSPCWSKCRAARQCHGIDDPGRKQRRRGADDDWQLNYSSMNFHVFAPSSRRTRTEAMSSGSKFPRFTPCFAPGAGSSGSQCVTHAQVLQ